MMHLRIQGANGTGIIRRLDMRAKTLLGDKQISAINCRNLLEDLEVAKAQEVTALSNMDVFDGSEDGAMRAEGEDSMQHLIEDILELIFARLPSPSIYKVRVLSRGWLSRLSRPASLVDEERKCLASWFQKMVYEVSGNRPSSQSYFPAIFRRDFWKAYDKRSEKWVQFPSSSFLPEQLHVRSHICIPGAVSHRWSRRRKFCVANVFTQSWKLLPPLLHPEDNTLRLVFPMLVSAGPSNLYKVVMICYHGRTTMFWGWSAQIYNSKSKAWTSHTLAGERVRGSMIAPVYLNGVIYILHDVRGEFVGVNVKDGSSETFGRLTSEIDWVACGLDVVALVVCNGELFLIGKCEPSLAERSTPTLIHILKIDVILLEVSQVTKARVYSTSFRFVRPLAMELQFFSYQKISKMKVKPC